jgi:hypothetical protein
LWLESLIQWVKMKILLRERDRAGILITMKDPKHATMKLRFPVLVLILLVLAYSCIVGCTGNRGNYGSTSKPAAPDITPAVTPPPVSPPRIPSTVTSSGTHFSGMAWGENGEISKETNPF